MVMAASDEISYEHFMKLHGIMSDGVKLPEDGTNYTVGPWLTFDPKTERHTGDYATEANELLKDANRPGFQVPDADKVYDYLACQVCLQKPR